MGSYITKKSFIVESIPSMNPTLCCDRNLSIVSRSVVLSGPNEAVLALSVNQKRLLRDTWKSDIDSFYEISSGVYEYIFNQSPETKTLFPSLVQCGNNWSHSHEFLNLTLKFAQVIDNVIKNINNPDKVGPILEEVGGRHVKLVSRGFTTRMLDTFRDALENSMEKYIIGHNLKEGVELDECLDAWDILAQFVMQRMEKGFKGMSEKVTVSEIT